MSVVEISDSVDASRALITVVVAIGGVTSSDAICSRAGLDPWAAGSER